jgi:glycerol-3-phosphate acyltransferase PlsX
MKTVALDAFGSDHAPGVEVEGAIEAARTGRVRVLLCGDRARLERELADRKAPRGLPIEIRHASQTITMHDAPSHAVRRKTDSSMRVATDLCKTGEAAAVVSAGNSGAMLACGLFVLKRIAGLDRPAILTTFPTRTGQAALLDMGANVECKPLHLVEFAVMGATFARLCHEKARPRVGVLSNGAEEHKGTDLTRGAHALLSGASSTRFDYLGCVEGRDIFSGAVDVVVCDGFSGNLVLKVTEGAAETLLGFIREAIASSFWARLFAFGLRPAFRRVKRRMDYAEQGGAPLLGVQGVAIICHGGSNALAIKNAILGADRFVDLGLAQALEGDLEAHAPLRERARGGLSEAAPASEKHAPRHSEGAASSQVTSR